MLLRKRYNSSDKRSRILTRWQTLRLSESFAKRPDESQAKVFLDFVATLYQLQKQLDIPYHAGRYLRDRLLTADEIPYVRTTLRDRIPRSSEQEIRKVMNSLSENKGSAGRATAFLEQDDRTAAQSYSSGSDRQISDP